MSLLTRLDRFNRRHPWSHNDFYGPWVVCRVVASGATRVLDVGCGIGDLIERLRKRGPQVTGMEPDPDSAARAHERFARVSGVTISRAAWERRESTASWEAITLVATLHHLPLEQTLVELRESLAPGGRLVVVGHHCEQGAADLALGLVSLLLSTLIGLVEHPRVAIAPPPHMSAPTAEPRHTLAQVRAAAARHLPEARIHRGLFWRHTLVYDRPA